MLRVTRWHSWVRDCATSRKVAGPIPDGVTEIFHSFRPHYGPGVDSASNRNEYPEYFMKGKGGLSWNLEASSLLEHSRPVQACNSITLPFAKCFSWLFQASSGSLRNAPEESRSHPFRGGRLKSRTNLWCSESKINSCLISTAERDI